MADEQYSDPRLDPVFKGGVVVSTGFDCGYESIDLLKKELHICDRAGK